MTEVPTYGVDVYIDKLYILPSFPTGLVKTESGFIVRSVETGLGRWEMNADHLPKPVSSGLDQLA